MQGKNIQWIPMIASIGIGAATYSMMTGKGGQLQQVMPMITGMTGQGQQNGQSQNQMNN
ncbi:hypothetical protein [Halalkalibacillus halophilus]|uniref:hypothetical protein n=1 Tax=Halalkalibacillus halophilus TaxID=392827 RepID=UPI00040B2D5F|nr:hypothetical protein [Halalkalibacillus halophilus]